MLNIRPTLIWTRTLQALCLLALAGAASASPADYHPMRFDRLSLDDGLSQSNVLTIWQDSAGLMWFGTENGLNSYNGYEFEQYNRERGNPDALASDFIYDLADDKDGNLWLATNGGGLAKLDRESGKFTTFRNNPEHSNSIADNVVRTLLVDEGVIWLGTRSAGLDRFDIESGKFTHFHFKSDAEHAKNPNEIHALYKDSAGLLWIGSNQGLRKLDPESGEFVSYQHDADDATTISDHRVRSILEDSNGDFWVGTYGGGLNRLDRKSGNFERFRHDADDATTLASDRVSTIFEDRDARLWIGTRGGLNLFDRKTQSFVRFSHDSEDINSLSDNSVTAMFQDRGGILWVGTQNHGISKWNPRSWSLGLENNEQLAVSAESQPNVTSFVTDKNGTVWVGTFGDGLTALDRTDGYTVHYRHDPLEPSSISDDRVMSLLLDSDGMLWVGTMTGGLNRLNTATGENDIFRHDPADPASLSADGIMAIFEASDGRIWVGTFGGGISRFDPETQQFTRFLADSGHFGALSSNRVTSFAEDADGRMWVGTDAGGLNLFEPRTESFYRFRHDPLDPQSLAADTVYSIAVDGDGTVWVGTQGGGLDRVVGNSSNPQAIQFANLSQSDGLPNDVIYGVEVAASGKLWLSTNYGISNVDPRSGEIRNMHRNDGLQSEEFNFGAHYQSANGELFFGGANGFNAFRPDDLKTNEQIPLVMLTGFINAGQVLKSGLPGEDEGIDISYKDDAVTFEFAAMDYAAPAENQYMYKLEGFDKQWIDLGNRRRASYTDLNDGNYLLRVKAANSDGVWNETGISMPLRVSPAPWDTWWAYLVYLALAVQLGIALWWAHQARLRREEEYSGRLEQEVKERTEELVERNKMLGQLNNALQESSLSDPLTGLKNRRFVFEEISRDIEVIRKKFTDERHGIDPRKASELVFMMIDLDNFKPINDSYGHAAGDQILLDVRDVLLSTCRKSDYVVRWGGDEFVVIAKQANPGEAEALAERIRSKIAEHQFALADGQIVRISCSIGFAAYPLFRAQADDGALDQILMLADSLMYEAKKKRNAWAGMLSPSEASVSENLDHEAIQPSSPLYRARRAGTLYRHAPDDGDNVDVEQQAHAG